MQDIGAMAVRTDRTRCEKFPLSEAGFPVLSFCHHELPDEAAEAFGEGGSRTLRNLTGWLTMSNANFSPIDDLPHRICAEYTDMPGLRVTYDQAHRLWGVDASTCRTNGASGKEEIPGRWEDFAPR